MRCEKPIVLHSGPQIRAADRAMALRDFLDEHPVDRGRVEAHNDRMLTEARARRLSCPREQIEQA